MNNKLTLDGADYELVQLDTIAGCAEGVPIIFLGGKMFAAKAIVDKRWPVDGPPEQKSEEQKDWEVLSFIYQHYIYCPRENGGYKKDIRYAIEPEEPSENDWLGSVPNGAAIYSVKRLIDGEVFSVGDRLWSNAPGVTVEITGFDIAKERAPHVIVRTKEHGYWSLLNIKKAEEKKEWKVLSFIENSHIYNADGAGKYATNGVSGNSTIWEAFHYGNIPPTAFITSVKRLTDGEVFSIGDYVDIINAHKITRIIIGGAPQNPKKDGSLLWLSTSNELYHHGVDLMVATKYKPKPIFKTHDGVEYFEGQENDVLYGVVQKGTWETMDKISVRTAMNRTNGSWIYFSTKEAMDKYIFAYKPHLSYEDVIKFILQEDVGETMKGLMTIHLTDFLKQKINGIQ